MVAGFDETNREVAPVGCANYGSKLVGQDVKLGQMGRASYKSSVCRRRSSSGDHRHSPFSPLNPSRLIVIVIQLLFLSSFCHGGLLGHGFFGHRWAPIKAGRGERRSVLSSAASVTANCTKSYTAVEGETCASLRTASGLSQAQILELNPGLDCKTLSQGQTICVEGISAHCARTIYVTQGEVTPTCASIITANNLSTEGFLLLNPGISCPEASGNNNSWPTSQLVCVAPGLGNLFSEYIGDSGLPITFADVQPLYQKYTSVIKHVILAFVIDIDANGTRTNGVFQPYWNSDLTPAAASAFKAANPDVRLFMSLGGPSQFTNRSWEDPSNATEWIDTAQASLTAIAEEYSIDGIDIDYESFPQGSANFPSCIGTLVGRLKGNNTIGLATIAPPGTVTAEYSSIMSAFSDQIDYVNFQFYSYQLPTVDSYIAKFNEIADTFVPWKLLASTQIRGTNSITGRSFLEAVEKIQLARGLPGVMLFDADHSVGDNFQDENLVLSLLNGEPYSNITNSTTLGPAPAPSPSLGAPLSSLAPASAPLTPGAPLSGRAPAPAPRSSLAPALGPGAPLSGLAPAPAPRSSLAPALGPGAPHSSLAPGPESAASGSSPAPESGAEGNSSPAPAPAPSSAPKRFPGSSWSSQGFGLFTAVLVLLFSV